MFYKSFDIYIICPMMYVVSKFNALNIYTFSQINLQDNPAFKLLTEL